MSLLSFLKSHQNVTFSPSTSGLMGVLCLGLRWFMGTHFCKFPDLRGILLDTEWHNPVSTSTKLPPSPGLLTSLSVIHYFLISEVPLCRKVYGGVKRIIRDRARRRCCHCLDVSWREKMFCRSCQNIVEEDIYLYQKYVSKRTMLLKRVKNLCPKLKINHPMYKTLMSNEDELLLLRFS